MELQLLRGSLATLPTLKEGEIGFCIDSRQIFIGTGDENILIGDSVAMERLMVSSAQLQTSNLRLKAEIAELRELIKAGGGGGGGSSGDAKTFSGLSIDHFVLFADDEEIE